MNTRPLSPHPIPHAFLYPPLSMQRIIVIVIPYASAFTFWLSDVISSTSSLTSYHPPTQIVRTRLIMTFTECQSTCCSVQFLLIIETYRIQAKWQISEGYSIIPNELIPGFQCTCTNCCNCHFHLFFFLFVIFSALHFLCESFRSVCMTGNNPAVTDLECLNCWNGVRAIGAGRHYIARVQGQPINTVS